jgi:hypothetical protein
LPMVLPLVCTLGLVQSLAPALLLEVTMTGMASQTCLAMKWTKSQVSSSVLSVSVGAQGQGQLQKQWLLQWCTWLQMISFGLEQHWCLSNHCF